MFKDISIPRSAFGEHAGIGHVVPWPGGLDVLRHHEAERGLVPFQYVLLLFGAQVVEAERETTGATGEGGHQQVKVPGQYVVVEEVAVHREQEGVSIGADIESRVITEVAGLEHADVEVLSQLMHLLER